MNTSELNDTAHKILDVAEYYTQTRGFNAFSYKDIQNEVGIKTSSIHYYFPTKQDLAITMATRFNERLKVNLGELSQKYKSAMKRLEAFNIMQIDIVAQNKFCLCGMLASDIHGLPKLSNGKLDQFFDLVESWLVEAIKLGQDQGEINASLNPVNVASTYLATLEGGMLIARAKKNTKYLEKILNETLLGFASH